MKIIYKRLLFAAAIVALVLVIRYTGFHKWFTLENIKANMGYLESMVRQYYAFSVLVFMALYVCVAALTIPVCGLLSAAGGYFFGVMLGTVYSCIAATIGATISFLATRYVLGRWLQERYAPKLVKFNKAIEEHGAVYLLVLHLVALIPFFLINILAGLTQVSTWTFVWTLAVGIIPGTAVYAFAGRQLHTMTSLSDIFSPGVMLAFGLLALFALLPLAITKIKGKHFSF